LVYLFERGFWPNLTIYLSGVAAAFVATAVVRRPFKFMGILTAAFPLSILAVTTIEPLVLGYQNYTQALTIGVFTALLGSGLLELSYSAYRRRMFQAPLFFGFL
jgi:hypothetical protein